MHFKRNNGLFILNCHAIIPGYGVSGKNFGHLVSTENILKNLFPYGNNIAQKSIIFPKIDFLKKKMGFESVAFTNTTFNLCQKFWEISKSIDIADILMISLSKRNIELYSMLEKASKKVISDSARVAGLRKDEFISNIGAHLHITSLLTSDLEQEMANIRKNLTITSQKAFSTLFLQQGCAGLLQALEHAQHILEGFSSDKKYVLITAANDMISTFHQRFRHNIIKNDNNIDYWLWPAIFGEGVGAMIVTKHFKVVNKKLNVVWQINKINRTNVIETAHVEYKRPAQNGYSQVYIRAKNVPETYISSITSSLVAAAKYYRGFDNIFRVCMHESNPILLKLVAERLSIPQKKIPTICAETGTLACVSSFSLLSLINEETKNLKTISSSKNLILALVGEAGGRIEGGYICLSSAL